MENSGMIKAISRHHGVSVASKKRKEILQISRKSQKLKSYNRWQGINSQSSGKIQPINAQTNPKLT
jgi:hypothetical protein